MLSKSFAFDMLTDYLSLVSASAIYVSYSPNQTPVIDAILKPGVSI